MSLTGIAGPAALPRAVFAHPLLTLLHLRLHVLERLLLLGGEDRQYLPVDSRLGHCLVGGSPRPETIAVLGER